MGRHRRFVQLLVVTQAPANDMVLLGLWPRLKRVEIVAPLLHGDEARAVHPRSLAGHQGRLHGIIPCGILSAVFVAGQITTGAVAEGVDGKFEVKGGLEPGAHRPSPMQQFTAIVTEQPAPHRKRRAWNLDGSVIMRRKPAQARDGSSERCCEDAPEADDRRLTIGYLPQGVQ